MIPVASKAALCPQPRAIARDVGFPWLWIFVTTVAHGDSASDLPE